MKMRIGKISTLIAQFSRPRVVNAAASELKVAPLVGEAESAGSKISKTIAVFGAAAGLSPTMAYASDEAQAQHGSECPCYPWPHKGLLGSPDTPRGLQIFQDVCSSCHSMSLGNKLVEFDDQETKAIAAHIQVVDAPNHKSPRILPYPPADLSLITKARLNDQKKYGLSLLSGYRATPAAAKIRGGLHQFQYNPYHFNAIPKTRGVAATQPQIREDDVTSLLGVLC